MTLTIFYVMAIFATHVVLLLLLCCFCDYFVFVSLLFFVQSSRKHLKILKNILNLVVHISAVSYYKSRKSVLSTKLKAALGRALTTCSSGGHQKCPCQSLNELKATDTSNNSDAAPFVVPYVVREKKHLNAVTSPVRLQTRSVVEKAGGVVEAVVVGVGHIRIQLSGGEID